MRLLVTSALATALIVMSAATASAVSFTLQLVSGSATVGGTPTYDLYVNTETENLQAWFVQVTHVGNSASAATGEAFIFQPPGTVSTPLGAPLINSIGGGTATGQWAYTVSPPGSFAPGLNFKYGSITFAPLQAGTLVIEVAPGGAVGGPGGLDLVAAGLVTFGSVQIAPIPEPGTALLVGLGLAGLGIAGRRK